MLALGRGFSPTTILVSGEKYHKYSLAVFDASGTERGRLAEASPEGSTV